MHRSVLIIAFLVGLYPQLSAQLGRSLQACWVHLDKAFYVTEDLVGYQLYLPPEFKDQQIAVQVILFDADGQARYYSYNHNQGRTSLAGSLLLDTSLSTNWYYLSFRVWDAEREREQVLLQVPLAVYNDLEAINPTEVSQQEPARWKDPVEVVDSKKLQLSIRTQPEDPQPGEEVRLTIQATDRRGRPAQAGLSVSVNDWSQLATSLAMGMDNLHSGDSLRVITPSSLTHQFYFPGLLLDEANTPLANAQLPITLSENPQELRTDAYGRFLLLLPPSTDRFSFTAEEAQNVKVQFLPQQGRLAMGKLFYTPAAFRYLEANRQRKNIYELMNYQQEEQLRSRQNLVQIQAGTFNVNTFDKEQNHTWQAETETWPVRPSWIWQSDLQTDANGEVTITYVQSVAPATFRIDVIGQTLEGERARTSKVYTVE